MSDLYTIDRLIDEVIEHVDPNLSYSDKCKWVLDNANLGNLITAQRVRARLRLFGQNTQNVQNAQAAPNAQNVQNVQAAQNAQNVQNAQAAQNAQNVQNVQAAQNAQNVQNAQNIQNVQAAQNAQNVQAAQNAQAS
ncbi:hypothetical protein RhiirA4_424179 [Rhizophagus irregularis]|uniref:Uncharacterized protein n=1 Tax=Rhizophagus irregularis TaxID=588596 RepID=A0A2I1GWI3_9GLOM|nr:hypothetical protein RhiirA4_424179 [Rhizophagus irregularis]